jgi:hypothetical protein
VRLEGKNARKNVARTKKNDWHQCQQKTGNEVAFPLLIGLETEVGESANSNTTKSWPKQNDGRNLNTPAKVAVEWKALHNRKDADLGQPCADPVERRREKAGKQHDSAEVGKKTRESLKTYRFGIHDMISMR